MRNTFYQMSTFSFAYYENVNNWLLLTLLEVFNFRFYIVSDAKSGLDKNQAINKKIHNFDPIIMKLGENDQLMSW